MQSYINHLLADIAGACQETSQQDSEAAPGSIEDYFEEIERWLESDPEYTFGYYCGLSAEQFPPPDRMTTLQMEEICTAFEKLLFSWNIRTLIPEDLPISKRYLLLVGILDRKVEIVNDGFITLEFCTYDPPSCPLGDHCTCKDLPEDEGPEQNKEDPTDELPY
jgi:hypothetical protein